MTAFFKSLDACPCVSVMNSFAFMSCSFSARASVQSFSLSPRGLVVCVLVRAAMDVDTVTVMPVAATNLVPVVMITPADLIFLAVVVVVYVGGVVAGIWWARRAHWDGTVYFAPFGECYHLQPDCRGLRNASSVRARRHCLYCGATPLSGATPTRATPRSGEENQGRRRARNVRPAQQQPGTGDA